MFGWLKKIVRDIVRRELNREVGVVPLKEQCEALEALIPLDGIIKARRGYMNRLRWEIAYSVNAGQSPREIIDYYWSEPAFQRVWGIMGMDKEHLEAIVVEVHDHIKETA